ncbi:DUF2231 domain-containing protein [Plantibacter sp. VKM Ac-2880]|nr:DUF2231 domain-containing protein [Plantibacter sp. VKM Ac-2880]
MVVLIPIGAWTASVVFDIVSLFTDDREPFVVGAQWLIGIGVVGAVLAAVFGLMDLRVIAPGTRARKTALTHLGFNLAAVVLFALSWIVRAAGPEGELSVLGLGLAWAAFLLVGVSGFLGGELSYRFGVRVAEEQTQRNGFLAPAAERR